jgi:DNA-binding transcriptional LysR family regulator
MRVLDEPLSIRQLEVFVALVDEGSFTLAARALGLSQSTVSGHVADLERRLGTQVVERDRKGVKPTAAGTALLAPARETLNAERSTRLAVEELTGLLRGRLVVGASTIPASYLVPGLFARFHAQYPEILLRMATGDSQDVLEGLQTSSYEVGVVGVAPEAQLFETTVVARDRLILIMAPGHPLAGEDALRMTDLASEGLVLREEGSGTRAATFAMLGAGGVKLPPRVICEVGSTEGCKAAVRAGLGVAWVSDLSVADELASGELVTVPVKGASPRRSFHLVTRKGGYLGPAARAFRDLVLEAKPIA